MHPDTANSIVNDKKRQAEENPSGLKTKKRKLLSLHVKTSGHALQTNCLRLVTEHGLAFRVLEYDAFQSIIKPIVDALPATERVTISRAAVTPLISKYADKVRLMIAAEVKSKLICIKVDGCTKGQRHFLGISAQFVVDGTLVVRPLATEELFVQSSAAAMKCEVTRVLEKFKIEVKNILTITSDNGANLLLMSKLFDKDAKELSIESWYPDEDDEPLSLDVLEEEETWPMIELQQGTASVQSVRCAGHTLQLAVEDGLKCTPSIKVTLNTLRTVAKALRTPTMVIKLRGANLNLPQLDVVTRWMSTYDMTESVLKLRSFVEANFSQEEKQKLCLDAMVWTNAEDVLAALAPAKRATVKLQERALLLGDCFKIWRVCLGQLQKMSHPLAENVAKAMERRQQSEMYADPRQGEKLSSLYNYPGFNASILLDPRYFSLLTPEQVIDGKQYLSEVYGRLLKLRSPGSETEGEDEPHQPQAIHVDSAQDTDSDSEEDEFHETLRRKNNDYLKQLQPNRRNTEVARLTKIIDAYRAETAPLSKKQDLLQYWNNKRITDPILSELALTVLAIPATQVTVERMFSSLRYILRPQRFNLSAEHVDDVMLLHSNPDLLRRIGEEDVGMVSLALNCALEDGSAAADNSTPSPGTSNSRLSSSSSL